MALSLCCSRVVACVLEVCEDVGDGAEGIVEVFCCAATAEEVVAVCVLDEEIGVSNVVAEVCDFVEASIGCASVGETAGLPAAFDAGDDGLEGRELCIVDFV